MLGGLRYCFELVIPRGRLTRLAACSGWPFSGFLSSVGVPSSAPKGLRRGALISSALVAPLMSGSLVCGRQLLEFVLQAPIRIDWASGQTGHRISLTRYGLPCNARRCRPSPRLLLSVRFPTMCWGSTAVSERAASFDLRRRLGKDRCQSCPVRNKKPKSPGGEEFDKVRKLKVELRTSEKRMGE